MAAHERPTVSELFLMPVEDATRLACYSRLGRAGVRRVIGPRTPAYQQLDWRSRGVTVEGELSIVTVGGDPESGPISTSRKKAMVMRLDDEEINGLKNDLRPSVMLEAVAYLTDTKVHIGYNPLDRFLYHPRPLQEQERLVGMRYGRGALSVTCGIYLPLKATFIGLSRVAVEAEAIPVNSFHEQFPGVVLT
jgi:hypothetical protein